MTRAGRAKFVREAVVQYRRMPDAPPRFHVGYSADVVCLLRRIIPDGPQERFVAIALDSHNVVVGWTTIGIGTTGYCVVSPADVLRFGILAGAPSLIVAHNHPSGDPSPSAEDIQLTGRLAEACEIVGLRLLDHVVLGDASRWVSFLDKGIMPKGRAT